MGINFFNAGDVQEATSYFGKAITKDPAHAEAYYRRPSRTWARASRPRPRPTSNKGQRKPQPDGEMGAAAKKAPEQLK